MATATVSGQSFIRTLRHYLEKNKHKLSAKYSNNNNTSIPASLLPFHNSNKLAALNNGFPYMSLLAVTSSVNTSISLENIPYMPQSSSFSLDIHYLYFLYVHFDELGLDIDSSLLGTLPPDAIVYIDHVVDDDTGKPPSLLSIGSVSSTMSTLSLGSGWQFWKKQEQRNNQDGEHTTTLQEDIVIIHDQLATISSLKLHMNVIVLPDGQPRSGKRAIQGYEHPLSQEGDVILSLIPFERLSYLELDHIHPRLIDGWSHFGSNLISLVIKRASLGDANEILDLLNVNDNNNINNSNSDKINDDDDDNNNNLDGDDVNQNKEIKKNQTKNNDQQQQQQKTNRLQMLSLQDNNITTLEKEPLQSVKSLTHLNLSSNLLVDVPSALSTLYNLYSLNLSYNMISMVNGINSILGNILELNLRGNRLTSIVGLDRLYSLEKLDIRNNRIEDITEINRLLTLPNFQDLWVAGNPFTETNSNYRIEIFNEFYCHHLEIRLDGTGPSFTEKLQMKSTPHSHIHDNTPLAEESPSTTPIPNSQNNSNSENTNNDNNNDNDNNNNIPNEKSASTTPSSSTGIARAKTKKTKRIIRLRQDIPPVPSMENDEPASPSSNHVLRLADLQDAVRPTLTRRKSSASRKSGTSSVHHSRRKSPLPRSKSPTPPLPLSLSNSTKSNYVGESSSNNITENITNNNNEGTNEEEDDNKGNQVTSGGKLSRISPLNAYRRQIENTRTEAGANWLRVFQEMNALRNGSNNIPTTE
ncbi:unnamed protein product [Cunninghamella blakesleeana]